MLAIGQLGAAQETMFNFEGSKSFICFRPIYFVVAFLFRILYTLSGSWGEPSIVRLEALHSSYLLEQGFTLFRPSP
jgi:hypothetical protein